MTGLLLILTLSSAAADVPASAVPPSAERPESPAADTDAPRPLDGGDADWDSVVPPPDKPADGDVSSPLAVGAWQALAGGGACFLLACPGAPLTLGLSLLAAPALVGWLATTLGDGIGGQRAPILWSLVGAYTGAVLVGGAFAAASIAGLMGGLVIINNGGGFTASQLVLFGALAGGLVNIGVTSLATGAGAALGYALTAEDKRPGDDGSGPSGLTTPGHPDDQRAPADDPTSPQFSMAF